MQPLIEVDHRSEPRVEGNVNTFQVQYPQSPHVEFDKLQFKTLQEHHQALERSRSRSKSPNINELLPHHHQSVRPVSPINLSRIHADAYAQSIQSAPQHDRAFDMPR